MSADSKRSSLPRFTLAAFFSAPKPCEDALADLGIAYNKLADQVEEAWAENERLDAALTRAELQLQELGSPTPPEEATAPFEDPGADAREPDPPGLREAQRQIMEELGYEMPNWTPRAERSPSAERTEVERLRLALTRAMDRGNQLEAERDSLAARLRAQGYNVTEILMHDLGGG